MIRQVLNHTSDAGGGSATTRRHYNLHLYAKEKRQALTVWEGLLRQIIGERPLADNVTRSHSQPDLRWSRPWNRGHRRRHQPISTPPANPKKSRKKVEAEGYREAEQDAQAAAQIPPASTDEAAPVPTLPVRRKH